MKAPVLISEIVSFLEAYRWDVHLTRDRAAGHAWKIHARKGDVAGSITAQLGATPLIKVTILTPYGYACTNAAAPSLPVAAQWVVNCARVDEAAAYARHREIDRQLRAANPWIPLTKFLRKNLILRNAHQRSLEASLEHTRERYATRYSRRLTHDSLTRLTQSCQQARHLETQHEGREVLRLTHDGNDVIAVVSPGREYLVTVMRPFEYVTLRIARHLLEGVNKPLILPAVNTPTAFLGQPGVMPSVAYA